MLLPLRKHSALMMFEYWFFTLSGISLLTSREVRPSMKRFNSKSSFTSFTFAKTNWKKESMAPYWSITLTVWPMSYHMHISTPCSNMI